jgi:hypothetical protein
VRVRNPDKLMRCIAPLSPIYHVLPETGPVPRV